MHVNTGSSHANRMQNEIMKMSEKFAFFSGQSKIFEIAFL